ncbi:hypothetical protein LZG04_15850 [Saccharothrix sp. S26]|uniref:hypothetical protein n=1 Tax=Saccharothrix sp. S26 TaxID=2907215 RepID=UPI001F478424|nr:hypothetical protein [Saccharothrix sp. S26]MCE6996259.1 hypothetical protein [Saccharothrix sp. S26]
MLWFARKRQEGRPVALAAIGALLSGFFVVIAPGVASAGAIVACPSGITEWKLLAGVRPKGFQDPKGSLDTEASPSGAPPWRNLWEGYRYTLVSAVPQFLVSDGRALDNGTDAPVSYSVTSSVSKTYKISATTGVSAEKVKDFLNFNVSTSIESSVTTQIGVTFSTVVPPRTRLIAEYGTDVYQVTYYIEAWRWRGPVAVAAPPPAPGTAGCEEWGYYPQSTLAPTRLETWRLRNG